MISPNHIPNGGGIQVFPGREEKADACRFDSFPGVCYTDYSLPAGRQREGKAMYMLKGIRHFFREFRDFAMKGNVLDLAIGVIIGGAFNTIVSSLVNNILMPLLGIVIGRIDISSLTFTIPGLLGSKSITLKYGIFLTDVLNFVLVAFSIFLMVKAVNRLHLRSEEKEAEKKLTRNEQLLTEIRDLLREQNRRDHSEE